MRRGQLIGIGGGAIVLVLIAAGIYEMRPSGPSGEVPPVPTADNTPAPPTSSASAGTAVSSAPQIAAPGPTTTVPPLPTLDAVRIGRDGQAVLAGRAVPGADVTLLDKGQPMGHVKADQNGEWVMLPPQPLPPGAASLSLTAQVPGEKAVAQSEPVAVTVPDHRQLAAALSLPIEHSVAAPPKGNDALTVQPGNSLWRLARQSYGAGVRYVEIYDANRPGIKDPNLIFPGQVLTLPAPASAPAVKDAAGTRVSGG
jgi:LysM repeat protein